MAELKVFGHITPDTDSTCAPIVYAWFLNEFLEVPAKAYVTGSLNKETAYVLDYFEVETPEVIESLSENDEVVIVDTNNPEELPDGIKSAQIAEIIDHHKLVGGLTTESPISITMKPLGCSSTIVWQMIDEYEDVVMPASMAGLLLAGIISDTLKFTSPTTTQDDKDAAEVLAEIAAVSVDELAEKMFAAKSDLSGMSASDIVTMDSKVFEMSGKKLRVSVLETTNTEIAKSMKDELLSAMVSKIEEEKSEHMFFFIVDIIAGNADLLVSDTQAKSLAEKAFSKEFVDDYMHLPGVVSRKKQMIPALEGAIAS